MTLEPVPSEGAPASPAPDPLTHDTLRQIVRSQLARRGMRGPSGPAISVLGVHGSDATLLRHGFDRPSEVVLGLALPTGYGGVVALASSVVAHHHRLDHGQLAIAVARDGAEICMVATDGDIVETYRPCGWLVDALRRSLGLATQPDHPRPLAFPLCLWLDRLMVEIVHGRRPLTWSDAQACCPVPARWRSSDPGQLGVTLASITPGWSRLRAAAAAGGLLPVPIEPAHAAWMDDPMFARWCLGFFPDFDDLRADVEFVAPPEVAAAVAATIDAAGDATFR